MNFGLKSRFSHERSQNCHFVTHLFTEESAEVILHLAEGKVTTLFGIFDEAGLLRQLGMLLQCGLTYHCAAKHLMFSRVRS